MVRGTGHVFTRKKSEECKGMIKDIDLLFIDGEHTYNGVIKDFETFKEDLNEKSILIFHDTMDEQVQSAVADIASKYSYNF